ncbi:unnamed protein product [Sphenostylis stenocarpa]|uniref:Uncharacterized protein n=1 Tax=Sphenostylis stenocarpa TaxID=92480 RepID=A0AA86VV35_9FABA|nr:unnamed protein product [Sphenostylis stenocarpa]
MIESVHAYDVEKFDHLRTRWYLLGSLNVLRLSLILVSGVLEYSINRTSCISHLSNSDFWPITGFTVTMIRALSSRLDKTGGSVIGLYWLSNQGRCSCNCGSHCYGLAVMYHPLWISNHNCTPKTPSTWPMDFVGRSTDYDFRFYASGSGGSIVADLFLRLLEELQYRKETDIHQNSKLNLKDDQFCYN